MKRKFKVIKILLALCLVALCLGPFLVKQVDAVEATGDVGSDTGSTDSSKSTKQVIKDSAKGTVNTIIEETFRAIGESVSQSIKQRINPEGTQTTDSLESKGENENTDTITPQSKSEQPKNVEPPLSEGRRPKPQRW